MKLKNLKTMEEYTLKPNTKLGRENSDIICNGIYVSRNHAIINVWFNAFVIEDLGSTNGTYVNNIPVLTGKAIALKEGDIITLGGLLNNGCVQEHTDIFIVY